MLCKDGLCKKGKMARRLALLGMCGVMAVGLASCGGAKGAAGDGDSVAVEYEHIFAAAETEEYTSAVWQDNGSFLYTVDLSDIKPDNELDIIRLAYSTLHRFDYAEQQSEKMYDWQRLSYMVGADYIPTGEDSGILQCLASGDAVKIEGEMAGAVEVPQDVLGYSKAFYVGPGRWVLLREVGNTDYPVQCSSTYVFFYDEAAAELKQVALLSSDGMKMSLMQNESGYPTELVFLDDVKQLTLVDVNDGSHHEITAGKVYAGENYNGENYNGENLEGEDFNLGLWRCYDGVWAIPGTDQLVLRVVYDMNIDGDTTCDYQIIDTTTGLISARYTCEDEYYRFLAARDGKLYFARGALSGAYNRLVCVNMAGAENMDTADSADTVNILKEQEIVLVPAEAGDSIKSGDIVAADISPDGEKMLLVTRDDIICIDLP